MFPWRLLSASTLLVFFHHHYSKVSLLARPVPLLQCVPMASVYFFSSWQLFFIPDVRFHRSRIQLKIVFTLSSGMIASSAILYHCTKHDLHWGLVKNSAQLFLSWSCQFDSDEKQQRIIVCQTLESQPLYLLRSFDCELSRGFLVTSTVLNLHFGDP